MSKKKARKISARITTLYFRGVDRDLKDCFKAWCARRGVSMTATVEKLMRATVRGRINLKNMSDDADAAA